MSFRVYFIQEAQDDLLAICQYIRENDSPQAAEAVLGAIEECCLSLDHSPQRGNIPAELVRVSVTHFRELHYKPYRIIYEVSGNTVYIHCILDGRRDLKDLLERRLLR